MMQSTTFASDAMSLDERSEKLISVVFHRRPGNSSSHAGSSSENSASTTPHLGVDGSEEPMFVKAPRPLVQSLLKRRAHATRCVLLACSYCGRWSTERFYTQEEARVAVLDASPAVHKVCDLAHNTSLGKDLLAASNLRDVLLGSYAKGVEDGSGLPPLIANLLRKRCQLNETPSATNCSRRSLSPTLMRFLEGHTKNVRELQTMLNANGLSLPSDVERGFLLNDLLEPGCTVENGQSQSAREERKSDGRLRQRASSGDNKLHDPHLLTPSQKMRMALHPELFGAADENDQEERTGETHRKRGSQGGGFDLSRSTLFIRNPNTFCCDWQDCEEERQGRRPFVSEKRDPTNVHSWPTVNACLCVRCGKLRLTSRFYPGCPLSFTCHLAAVPSERDCDVPESPLLAGNGSAVAPVSRRGRPSGSASAKPVELQEVPSRASCGQLVSEEDPFEESKQLHGRAQRVIAAHAADLKAKRDEVVQVAAKKPPRGRPAKAIGAKDVSIHSDIQEEEEGGLKMASSASTSLLSTARGVVAVGGGGSPTSTQPLAASTATLTGSSGDIPLHPLAPVSAAHNLRKGGGKRARSGGAGGGGAAVVEPPVDELMPASKESWVACDDCKKWRIVPREVMLHVERTGVNWYCWQNVPPRSCAEPEDEAK